MVFYLTGVLPSMDDVIHDQIDTHPMFDLGETKSVPVVEIAGHKVIRGGSNLADGAVSAEGLVKTMANVKAAGFAHSGK